MVPHFIPSCPFLLVVVNVINAHHGYSVIIDGGGIISERIASEVADACERRRKVAEGVASCSFGLGLGLVLASEVGHGLASLLRLDALIDGRYAFHLVEFFGERYTLMHRDRTRVAAARTTRSAGLVE